MKEFTDFYEESFSRLKGIACIWVTLQDAEDIVQDVLTRMWSNWEKMSFVEDLYAYAFMMVRNSCLDKLKHAALARNYNRIMWSRFQNSYEVNDPSRHLEYKETEQRLKMAIESLRGRNRQVFELSRDNGMKYHEIAEHLGISINTVECHMVSALSKLREMMEVA